MEPRAWHERQTGTYLHAKRDLTEELKMPSGGDDVRRKIHHHEAASARVHTLNRPRFQGGLELIYTTAAADMEVFLGLTTAVSRRGFSYPSVSNL